MSAAPAPATDSAPAVLPFENIGGDRPSNRFVLGVHAEIITQLRTERTRVASRSAALQYRETTKNEREIASELGVVTLLTGSMQRSGGQVHSRSRSRTRRRTGLWAESYDRELTPRICSRSRARSRSRWPGAERPADRAAGAAIVRRRRRTSPRSTSSTAGSTPEESDLTRRTRRGASAEQAVALDTAFVGAWGLLAQRRSWRLRRGVGDDTTAAYLDDVVARSASPRARSRRTTAQGYYRYYAHGDFAGALARLTRAKRTACSPTRPRSATSRWRC